MRKWLILMVDFALLAAVVTAFGKEVKSRYETLNSYVFVLMTRSYSDFISFWSVIMFLLLLPVCCQ